jgi:alpha-1,6-mannosyltransferase
MPLKRVIIAGAVLELCYASVYLSGDLLTDIAVFIIVQAFAFLLLAVGAYLVVRSPSAITPRPSALTAIVVFGLVFRLTLVMHPAVASDDIYRYLWDGRVALHGINPFLHAPASPALEHLRTAELPANINFPEMRTIYPPLSQWFFLLSNALFGASQSGMKLLLVLCDMVSMLLLVVLLRQQKKPPELVALYAWSPLPVLYFGLDGHIDALGILFLLLFLYLVSRRRTVAGAIALGLAVLAKLYPLLVWPFSWAVARSWPKKLALIVLPPLLLVLGAWLYMEPTGGLMESFAVYSSTFEFNGSIFKVLLLILDSNTNAHLVSGLLFLGYLLAVFVISRPILEKTHLAFLGFIVFSASVQPWYLTWLAAIVVLRWSPAVFVLLGTSNFSNLVVYQYRATGNWSDSVPLLLAEYLPFYGVLIWEWKRGGFASPLLPPAEGGQ